MAEIADLSVTDASNTGRFPESQNPSTVNDGARALEGLLARYARDFGDGVITTAGTSTAYTLAPNRTVSAYYTGLAFFVKFHTACGASATVNVSSIGAKTIKKLGSTDLAAGDVGTGQYGIIVYDGTYFQLLSPGTATFDIVGLTAETSLAVGDSIPIYDLSETANIKMTVQNFFNGISALTAETSPATGDSFLIYDASETASNTMTFENYLKIINALTADASPDTAADYVVTYDASASGPKKVLLNLVGRTSPFGSNTLFTSTDQTITAAGSLTLAHGLSSTPKFIQISLVCQSANLNYSANDVVPICWGNGGNASNNNVTCTLDSTNVNVRFGSAAAVFAIGNKTTGGGADIDATKWKMRVYAWY